MIFLHLDRDELREYNTKCAEQGLPNLNLVEANVLKAMMEMYEESGGEGASHEEVIEVTGYTPGQVDHAVTFLARSGLLYTKS